MADEQVLASQIIKELGDLARELSRLTETPAWVRLSAEYEKVKETYVKGQARKLTSGGVTADPLDQRAIDYQRGFFRGAEFVLGMPRRSDEALNAAIERQENQ